MSRTVRHFDVYNGHADRLCALQQLRLIEPREAQLITGLKRDIELLRHVAAGAGDVVTVLDLSLDRDREPLVRLLAAGGGGRAAATGIERPPAAELNRFVEAFLASRWSDVRTEAAVARQFRPQCRRRIA